MHDLRQLMSISFRWLPFILGGAVLAASLAYLVTTSQPSVYEGTSELVVEVGPNPGIVDIQVARELAARYVALATSRDLLARVAESTGTDIDVEELATQVQVDREPDSAILKIAVKGATPEGALSRVVALGDELIGSATSLDGDLDLVQEAADEYIAALRTEIDEIRSEMAALQALPDPPVEDVGALRDRLDSRQDTLVAMLPQSSEYVRYPLAYIEEPTSRSSRISPQPLYWAAIAAMAGLIVAAGAAFIVEYIRNRLRDGRQVESATGAPFVGTVTEKKGDARQGPMERVVTLRHPNSEEAEAYRRAMGIIHPAIRDGRCLLITGPAASDSIAVVAANIAAAFAQSGERTILADADFDAPFVHALFGLDPEPGLTTILMYPNQGVSATTVGHPMLRVVPSGTVPSDPSDFVAAIRISDLVTRLKSEADILVVRGPQLPGGPDAAILARALKSTLIVVEDGGAGDRARDAARSLEVAGALAVGAMLIRRVRGSHGRPRRRVR